MKNKKTITPTIFQKFSWREYKKVWREDVEIAREEGKAIGASKKINEIAISLLKNGCTPEFVNENTGLSLAEVEALKASL